MRKFLFLAVLGVSCGGDSLSASDACQQEVSALCDKMFNCFSKDVLDAAKSQLGLNAADCKTKFNASECNADNIKCDLGKTYQADKAEECVNGVKNLSCNDIQSIVTTGKVPTPAACDLVCK